MKFTVSLIYGSVRENRMGIRAAHFLKTQIEDRGIDVQLIDPVEYPLPLLDKMYKEYKREDAPENMRLLSDLFVASDGFVLLSGEYNHSVPPALKNLLDHFQKEYHYKPSAIATYSAGSFGGVRAAVHLRAIAGELGMPSIPTMLPFPKVGVNFDKDGHTDLEAIFNGTKKFLDEFGWYLEAFKKQREKP